ncbi:hypothetical protein [Nonomuraea zeae]|uniref:DUF4386 domain-containing protein n=1 Tax=Nonomuraea zeae TaxID=1642303 RepID=A0A5S4FGF4_9ACTN|nr:hypothetical protein [Nonomuraea zeae]TMR18649.1 hypothetical protein ETD85_53425 [Nonomuraea zeae]
MNEPAWQRWGMGSGLVAVAAGAAAVLFERGAVSPEQPAPDIAAFFAANGSALVAQSLLFVAGAVALLWFLGCLRVFLAESEGGPARLSTLAFGAGVAQVVLNLIAQAWQIGLATAPPAQVTGRDLALMNAMFALANVPVAVMFAAVALVSLRHRAFPRWLGWLAAPAAAAYAVLSAGIAVTSGPLAPGGWLQFLLYPALVIWLVPATIVMIARSGRSAAPEHPGTPRE